MVAVEERAVAGERMTRAMSERVRAGLQPEGPQCRPVRDAAQRQDRATRGQRRKIRGQLVVSPDVRIRGSSGWCRPTSGTQSTPYNVTRPYIRNGSLDAQCQ